MLEVANVLVVSERRRRITPAQAGRFLKLLTELPISVVETDPSRIFAEVLSLARGHQLSAYDARYLDLAISLGLPLATSDRALRHAAEASGVATI
jgi:predicted nucleic acid-binding protein